MNRWMLSRALLLALALGAAAAPLHAFQAPGPPAEGSERVVANDNRAAGGTWREGVLELREEAPARLRRFGVGETYDFEWTPARAMEAVLEVRVGMGSQPQHRLRQRLTVRE